MRPQLLTYLISLQITLSMRNVTLFGNDTLGYYYVEAYVGTPPQKKSLILDTGSHLTIFPCYGCYSCRNHLYNIFDSSKSSTFDKVNPAKTYFDWQCNYSDANDNCRFDQSYTEGSEYTGFYAIDNFIFENELNNDRHKNLKHVFGCAMKETNLFYSQEVDGIIGFGVTSETKGSVNRIKPPPYYTWYRAKRR